MSKAGRSLSCESLVSLYAATLLLAVMVIARLLDRRRKEITHILPAVADDRKAEIEEDTPAGVKQTERIAGGGGHGGGEADREVGYRSAFPCLLKQSVPISAAAGQKLEDDKELYWKLQNIEDHPDVIPTARQKLLDLLDATIASAHSHSTETILSTGSSYSPAALRSFLHANHTASTSKYEAYLSRRNAGGPRELLPTHAYAVEWLRQAAVVKYVDGGWTAGVLESVDLGADFGIQDGRGGAASSQSEAARREAAKIAWQVVSEEFGDGDLGKNHVHLYHSLIDSLGIGGRSSSGHALDGSAQGFDGLPVTHGIQRCWTAALAQQLIGLFAPEFFPESLGFNMAYETLPYHLLVTSWELRELQINDNYFALHIAIDNADTGHAALAMEAVERYLAKVEEAQGVEARDKAWRRVQAGVCLADELPTTPSSPRVFDPTTWLPIHTSPDPLATPSEASNPSASSSAAAVAGPHPASYLEAQVVRLLMRKSKVANAMHCPSRLKIAGETLSQWLDPATLTLERSTVLARALRGSPGGLNTERSGGSWIGKRVMRELEWGGRMFGAFSRAETQTLRLWLFPDTAALPEDSRDGYRGAYERFAGPLPAPYEFFPSIKEPIDLSNMLKPAAPGPSLVQPLSVDRLARLLPLWLTSLALLQRFPLSPARLASPEGMIVLRLLRTQLGFPALHGEQEICAGLDHFESGGEVVGLYEIGQALAARIAPREQDHSMERRQATKEVQELVLKLRGMRTRPYRYMSELLGALRAISTELYASEAATGLLVGVGRLSERLKTMAGDLEDTFRVWERMLVAQQHEGYSDEQKRYEDARCNTSQIIHA